MSERDLAIQNAGHGADAFRRLALLAAGRTGADIERLVREARQRARRQRRSMTWDDLERAIRERQPRLPSDLRWRVAVHECGHCIASVRLKLGRVRQLSIEASETALGFLAAEAEIRILTEARALDILCLHLAGRAAEEVILGSISLGSGGHAASDLANATDLALAMETRVGCGKAWPLLYRDATTIPALLFVEPGLADRVSARLDEAFDRARCLLADHKGELLALANALVERDTLEGPEIAALMAAPSSAGPSS
ncbi:ATP-dependent Zn protease [Pseudorhizobium halotolerans]|uniref:ATP-dependent Zn protease n=1 Tax=Pseudorhizobium halotolerans TaxID=1233081 RepID=A0ABN7JEH8_9HYPH|nr:ATP-dependent Zn protease [Pseudorhizobium halotolerans]CAD7026968.1 ATP-dependent Zn protease [Pseudorhizobium halotolerans]